MKKNLTYVAAVVLYFLHQDLWFWNNGTLVLGVIPIGLLYHFLYCLAASLLLTALIRNAWPARLKVDPGEEHSQK